MGRRITLELGDKEMGMISIALDHFPVPPGSINSESEWFALQRKWDSLYRTYHALPACVKEIHNGT